jgi:hypothetical protein
MKAEVKIELLKTTFGHRGVKSGPSEISGAQMVYVPPDVVDVFTKRLMGSKIYYLACASDGVNYVFRMNKMYDVENWAV